MNTHIYFQRSDDDGESWKDFYDCRAYINGVNGSEFFVANAGFDASLAVNISCRWHPRLMQVIPTTYRAVADGVIYDLLSPADDKENAHKEVIFRARRIFSDDVKE